MKDTHCVTYVIDCTRYRYGRNLAMGLGVTALSITTTYYDGFRVPLQQG